MKPDAGKLEDSFLLLRKLRNMSRTDLVHLHYITFTGTPYMIKIPDWLPVQDIIRRIWYYKTVKNYHYPKDNHNYKLFVSKAKLYLKNLYQQDQEDAIKNQHVKDFDYFTLERISCMSINEVDRHLFDVGVFAEVDEDMRRKLLFDWYNTRVTEIAELKNLVIKYSKGRLNNRFSVRELVLNNPEMSFDEMVDTYGHVMPTVTRSSWTRARSDLRKVGYPIPKLTAVKLPLIRKVGNRLLPARLILEKEKDSIVE